MTADHRTMGYDASYAVFDSPLSHKLRQEAYGEERGPAPQSGGVIELSRRKALARLVYLAAAV